MDEYEGGVAGPDDVVGRLGVSMPAGRKLALDARSDKAGFGDDRRAELRRSFIRLSRSKPSNWTRSSRAHSSP